MPKLYSAKEIIKSLRKAGFEIVSQKGSHIKLRGVKAGKLQTVIVPNHKEIAKGTLSSILNQANLTKNELEEYL
ncbi:type II toxin-antitoxin system HicA family toxin [Candidatus Gottesmanbacteria bacterium]|nr:type II toxin-antitoxin system HicA family toxin [Candidatus Gottesmanbacteria bacterium]